MTFTLDNSQRKKISKLAKSSVNSKIHKRLLALLWIDQGKSIEEVADLLLVSARSVRNWLKLFKKKGSTVLSRLTIEEIKAIFPPPKPNS
jgi:predicted transcriptional regulator